MRERERKREEGERERERKRERKRERERERERESLSQEATAAHLINKRASLSSREAKSAQDVPASVAPPRELLALLALLVLKYKY